MALQLKNVVFAALAVLSASAYAVDVPETLPDPDGSAVATDQPLRIYIMMGQSNMVGFGQIGPADAQGSLEQITRAGMFPHLVDDEGNWTVRNDVWCVQVTAGNRRDWLQPGFGARNTFIGPELGFGHVVGYAHDGPVLIIKATMGNRCLGWDLMPPSSRTITPEEHENQWYQGWQYDIHMTDIRRVLDNLQQHYPGYNAEQGYEIAGFAWWQGHKDQSTPGHVNDNWANSYERYLVDLINDLREAYEAPEAPFVLATIAFGGEAIAGSGLTIVNAQLAVDGESGEHEDFEGNVATVDARPFWRDVDVSPAGAGHHYNHNAETYMLVGDALGRAMVQLENQE